MEHVFTIVVQRFFMDRGCRYQLAEDWPCEAIYKTEEAALEYARNLANEYTENERHKYKITEQRNKYNYKIVINNIDSIEAWTEKVITIREQCVN